MEKNISFFPGSKIRTTFKSFWIEIKYNAVNETRSPRFVIPNKKANCFEGASIRRSSIKFFGIQTFDCRYDGGKR